MSAERVAAQCPHCGAAMQLQMCQVGDDLVCPGCQRMVDTNLPGVLIQTQAQPRSKYRAGAKRAVESLRSDLAQANEASRAKAQASRAATPDFAVPVEILAGLGVLFFWIAAGVLVANAPEIAGGLAWFFIGLSFFGQAVAVALVGIARDNRQLHASTTKQTKETKSSP